MGNEQGKEGRISSSFRNASFRRPRRRDPASNDAACPKGLQNLQVVGREGPAPPAEHSSRPPQLSRLDSDFEPSASAVVPYVAPVISAGSTTIEKGYYYLTSTQSRRTWKIPAEIRFQSRYGRIFLAGEVFPGGGEGDHYMVKRFESAWLEKCRQQPHVLPENQRREISIMQKLAAGNDGKGHPNVLSIVEAVRDHEDYMVYVVMPYCPHGTLEDVIPAGGLTEAMARPLFRQLLRAMEYLQQLRVCHRDISVDNIFLGENDQAILADFGAAILCPPGKWVKPVKMAGKLVVTPPEAYHNEPFDGFALDVWSIGTVLYKMLTDRQIFRLGTVVMSRPYSRVVLDRDLRSHVLLKGFTFTADVTALLQSIFHVNPRQRPTVQQMLAHPWLATPALPEERIPPLRERFCPAAAARGPTTAALGTLR